MLTSGLRMIVDHDEPSKVTCDCFNFMTGSTVSDFIYATSLGDRCGASPIIPKFLHCGEDLQWPVSRIKHQSASALTTSNRPPTTRNRKYQPLPFQHRRVPLPICRWSVVWCSAFVSARAMQSASSEECILRSKLSKPIVRGLSTVLTLHPYKLRTRNKNQKIAQTFLSLHVNLNTCVCNSFAV